MNLGADYLRLQRLISTVMLSSTGDGTSRPLQPIS